MRTIKDVNGDEWKIPALTVGRVIDIREYAEIDFLEMRGKGGDDAKTAAGQTLAKLYDAMTLGNVLWVLLKEQCEKRNVDERAFGYLFDASQFGELREAVLNAVVDFTQPPTVAKEIKADLPGMISRMENALIAVWKNSVTDSAESLELTPAA